MKTQKITNPYYLYILIWSVVFVAYSLHWSNLAAPLSGSMYAFFIFTFFVSFIFGYNYQKKVSRLKIEKVVSQKNNPRFLLTTIIIICMYCIEFLYNGGIPMFLVLQGSNYDYSSFGIPTFHVILHIFSTFYGIYLFEMFLVNKKNRKMKLLCFGMILFMHLLIFNRGSMMFIILASGFCFFMQKSNIKKRTIIMIAFFAVFGVYMFGKLGNIRSFKGNSEILPLEMKAPASFMESNIPKEFYWGYMYIALPLANFQETVNEAEINYQENYLEDFLIISFVPDFISKRISSENKFAIYQIHPIHNVATVYAIPFVILGWFGALLVFFYMIFLIEILKKFFAGTKYFNIGISILLAIIVLNTFDNMFTFSGNILVLFFSFLIVFIEKITKKKNKANKNNILIKKENAL